MWLQPLVQKEHRDTGGSWSPAAEPRGARYPEDACRKRRHLGTPSSQTALLITLHLWARLASCRGSSRGAAEDYMEVLEHSLGNPCVGGEEERGKKHLCD